MGSDKQSVGLFETLKMERVRTILTHRYPYPHEHSRHAIIAVVVGCLFFISSDNMHTLIQKLDNNIKWWSMYGCLLGFFYFFSSPFIGKTIKPSYSNFSRWYIAWILVAALYHLPSFLSMGVDLRMNLSLFLTIYVSSILFLLVFHIMFLGLWYIGLVARVAGKKPEILTIIQNCAVLSIACCVFYSHCGNRAIFRQKPFERRNSSWFSFWKKEERNTWVSKFIRMNELKDQVCSSWFAPVGSASDYPLLSKWVIYGELACSGSCPGSSDEISPIYSLWATFIGLYIANYVVERSSGWALTHPLSVKEYEELKKKQMKPDFLDMVPWYSGTSADLFKTAFDLLVSVTVFVGRFDMRMMQASMNKVQDGVLQGDILYDHFSEKEDLWFDFMADTGDGGNSSYTIARLLAQPSIRVNTKDSFCVLPRGDLLLIGGDLAYPNPSAFTYERRLFCPFEYALQPPPWYKVEHIAVNKPEEMTPQAEIISTKYTKSIIKSCAALSYIEAQARMDDSRLMDPLTIDLRNMNALAKVMRLRRIERGALTLASAEVKFQIDTETHDPLDIGMYQIREANQMVEEFMLAANVSVAEKILKHFPFCSLLRRHPSPTREMLEPLLRTAAAVGLSLDVSSSKALADSLDHAVGDDPYFNKLIRILATRCMTQAVYFCSGDLSPPEFHHYGLAAPLYTHFTSPIRRYADVIVHRLLAASLGLYKLPTIFQDKGQLTSIADNLNYRHRNAQMAGRASVELHTLIYFRKRPTDTEARIVKIRSNGFIVFVPKYGIEGPVYLTPRGEKGGGEWVVDEQQQKVKKMDGSVSYSVLQAVTIHMEVIEPQPNRPKLELALICR